MPKLEHIRHYMTPAPQTVTGDALLDDARSQMKALGVHHMPVLKDDALVGILSEKDVLLAEALLGDAHATVRVSLVMTDVPFTCGPEAHLDAVAGEMLERHCGSAIIVDREEPTKVLGIFTITDALRVLKNFGDE